jgi:uncharacterized protein (DUF2267 family)
MTVPPEYVHATRDFDRFMQDFMDISSMATHHQSYAVVRAVLHVFRDHLTIGEALRFAEILPAVLRAIFVEDWHPTEMPKPFPARDDLLAEVKANRRDHNLAGDTAIRDVAEALRRNVDRQRLDQVLAALPPAARAYWQV